MNYTLTENVDVVVRDDGATIPKGHPWWLDYQDWLTAGNTPQPAKTLSQAQADQITVLNQSYDAAIQIPVSYMGTIFQADVDSQILVAKCLAPGAVPAGFYWQDVNNAQIPMTFAQLQGLAGVMLAQGQVAFTKLQGYKTQVRGAKTVAAVQAITWQ